MGGERSGSSTEKSGRISKLSSFRFLCSSLDLMITNFKLLDHKIKRKLNKSNNIYVNANSGPNVRCRGGGGKILRKPLDREMALPTQRHRARSKSQIYCRDETYIRICVPESHQRDLIVFHVHTTSMTFQLQAQNLRKTSFPATMPEGGWRK